MPGRKYTAGSSYRYGFNGKELDNDPIQYDYGFRIYDARICRFKSTDPLFRTYPYYTPYQFASNSPILAIDVDGLESSNDKNPSSVQATTPPVNPSQVTKYDISTSWMPITKMVPNSWTTLEHSHTGDIDYLYDRSGGDTKFNSNSGTISYMNSNSTAVKPGSILLPPSGNAVNTSSAYYSASESGSQKSWINLMLGGMIKGTIPENIVFSENSTVSNYLRGSAVLNKAVRDWYKDGQKPAAFGVKYDIPEQINDVTNNSTFFSIGNFVGSARAQITYNYDQDILQITFTNVTSVHSGDYSKHFYWHNDQAPSLTRNPIESNPQPYTNFSQTYQLKFSYKSIMQQIGNPYKLIE